MSKYNQGIYRITIAGRHYFGQAGVNPNFTPGNTGLNRRRRTHLKALKEGTHTNRIMQNRYNKYKDFHFEVMLYCDKENLTFYEQRFVDAHPDCMNINKECVTSTLGTKHTEETLNKMRGRKFTKEHRENISKARKGKKIGPCPKHSKRMSGKGHPRYNHTIYTFQHKDGTIEECTQYELRTKYNLNSSNVSQLIKGNYKQLKGWSLLTT